MSEFEFIEDPQSDALTVADNTAGPNGTIMTVQDRLRDKLARHGPESRMVRANPERDDYIRAAAARVAHRLVLLEEVDAESQSGDPNTTWILRGMSRLTPATGRGRAAGVSAT